MDLQNGEIGEKLNLYSLTFNFFLRWLENAVNKFPKDNNSLRVTVHLRIILIHIMQCNFYF